MPSMTPLATAAYHPLHGNYFHTYVSAHLRIPKIPAWNK